LSNLLHIGGGTKYQMELKKIREDSKTGCVYGCEVKSTTEIKLPSLEETKFKVFGVGVSLKIVPIQFKVEYTHNWKKSMKNTKETKVSFVLGDENPGDEFVVDVFYDTKYGSVVFDTIAGRSKCPWEAGTLH
jgi:hypothetical protein